MRMNDGAQIPVVHRGNGVHLRLGQDAKDLLLHALGLVPVPLVLRCLDAALALMCFHLRNILNSRAYRLCRLRFGLRAEEQQEETAPDSEEEKPGERAGSESDITPQTPEPGVGDAGDGERPAES